MEKATICPGIVTSTGETIYPTGDEWLLAFAIKGCDWAVKAWEEKYAIKMEALRVNNLIEGIKDCGSGI